MVIGGNVSFKCWSDGSGGSTASARRTASSSPGILSRERPLRHRRERRRPQPEVAVGVRVEPLVQPLRRGLEAAVEREPLGQLLGGLLRSELVEALLVREEPARLQLEQRGHEHQELSARVEIDARALGELLDEGEDDVRHLHVAELELLFEDEREEEVEGPLEGVQVQVEVTNRDGAHRPRC